MYKNGEIYLQSLSSMLPPIILNPKQGADILDMAAAPGGKTTQMSAITQNQAHITACELNKIRAERLKFNIEKQGASCVYVMVKDSRKIDDFFAFDQILLDAPCSGSGTLNSNDSNIKKYFTKNLIEKSTKSQIELLKKAIRILKPGGKLVYSTCSILQAENEEIVEKAIKGTDCKIVPIDFKGIEDIPVLPCKINGALCVSPNEFYEGFFIAKLQKA
jgi:NOL1/NOP2/sun family putative RNA methylase